MSNKSLPSPHFLGLSNASEVKLVSEAFDSDRYLSIYPDVAQSGMDPFEHYAHHGWQEKRSPTDHFDEENYLATVGDIIPAGVAPFAHYITSRHQEISSVSEEVKENKAQQEAEEREALRQYYRSIIASEFDDVYYRQQANIAPEEDAILHYLDVGYIQGLDPTPRFSTTAYLRDHTDVARSGVNPFFHYLAQGKKEGREARDSDFGKRPQTVVVSHGIDEGQYQAIKAEMDEDFYRSRYGDVPASMDVVVHYLSIGVHKNYDPCADFSTSSYLRAHPDVQQAGVNPFFHYLAQGRDEGRQAKKSMLANYDPSSGPRPSLISEHQRYCAPGPDYEEFDPTIIENRKKEVKALAFYLPQFHAFPENDAWWGKGFTEWRNTSRALPRYVGHVQPRIPRDLGFYDLTNPAVMKNQVNLAKSAGLHGFCFYYYSFNGKRLLDEPVEQFLSDNSLDFPFLLIWANENWTKTWDGLERSVLMSQDYREEDEDELLADIARHLSDPRYIRIDGRPLFVIYRPSLLPDAKERFSRWRDKWKQKYKLDPLIFMAQGFGEIDPTAYGLDGAMEFPPHKVAAGLHPINNDLELLDEEFSGNVLPYEKMVERSLAEEMPSFPLIKGVTLNWDNEARRPGRGMSFMGATPTNYENWLRGVIKKAKKSPVLGENIVVINAWNEWAEGTYLEPDVFYGSAYLNATARAICNTAVKPAKGQRKLILIGHDAYRHGAQILLLHIGKVLKQQFSIDVRFLILGEGPMLDEYRALAPTSTADRSSLDSMTAVAKTLSGKGYRSAIMNTTVSGAVASVLHSEGIEFVSLIHELPTLIREYKLEAAVADISAFARHIVFPAEVVRNGFSSVARNDIAAQTHIRTQGLYNQNILDATPMRGGARSELNIPQDAHVVINVGYADSRKGFDIFAKVAQHMAQIDPKIHFIWVGNATADIKNWLVPDILQSNIGDRFRLTGHVSNVEKYYAAANVFFITSREDPFPSVVMEAMQAGLPVVGFKDSGGCVDLFSKYGSLVNRNDLIGISEAIKGHLTLPSKKVKLEAERRRKAVKVEFQFDQYCHDLVKLADPSVKSVSVVVPNYNYAYCLPERMDSIFDQSYPVLETIVLDDKSPDNSVEVLRQHAELRKRNIQIIVNEKNSGSVFRQWRKAAETARGEFIWIAEADDVATPDFLSSLIDVMIKHQAAIAFSDSWQIDTGGARTGDSYAGYMADDTSLSFGDSFIIEGRDLISKALCIKNIIMNVSGVLWSRTALLAALDAAGDRLYEFKVAGDWYLYVLAAMANTRFCYVAKALNGHRRHATSVTHALNKAKHFEEIVSVQNYAVTCVGADESLKKSIASYRLKVASYLGVD